MILSKGYSRKKYLGGEDGRQFFFSMGGWCGKFSNYMGHWCSTKSDYMGGWCFSKSSYMGGWYI